MSQPTVKLTIIVPPFNEEAYIGPTLDPIQAAEAKVRNASDVDVETIVVDNNSTDSTVAVARAKGATVVHEPVQGIARARNTGVRHADGDVLVFVDADVNMPDTLLEVIQGAMRDPACVRGGVDVDYRPKRLSMRFYLRAWRLLGQLSGMAQGATQFCRKSVFEQIGGYDEKACIGEDVDFYWSLKRYAKRTNGSVRFILHTRVQPSSRRFDKWPLWKILVWTNPLFISLFRRRKRFWAGWHSDAVR